MKAEELMIEDWVYSLIDRDGKTAKEPQRIKGIWADEYNGKKVCSILTDSSDVWYPIGTFEPIPITPEILKKNGFILSEKDGSCEVYEYLYDDTFMQIMFYLKDKIIIVRIEKYNYESEYYMNALHNCEIKYIHKLQHAMRLCGINKEIILEE